MVVETPNTQLASDLSTVVSRLIKKLRQHTLSAHSLSLTERSTIALLDQYGASQPTELAAMEKITTQSMSQILGHLLELGYIVRTASSADKRKSIISLSKTGQEALHALRNERDAWLHEALRKVCTVEERELLRRAIGPLNKLVDFSI